MTALWTHHIRQEAILERSVMLIEEASGEGARLVRSLEHRLLRSRLAGLQAKAATVRLGPWTSRALPALQARLGDVPEVRLYALVREVGIHLEVTSITAAEVPFVSRLVATLVCRGAWWAGAVPQGGPTQERLAALLTLFDESLQVCARRLIQPREDGLGRVRPKDVYEEWSYEV